MPNMYGNNYGSPYGGDPFSDYDSGSIDDMDGMTGNWYASTSQGASMPQMPEGMTPEMYAEYRRRYMMQQYAARQAAYARAQAAASGAYGDAYEMEEDIEDGGSEEDELDEKAARKAEKAALKAQRKAEKKASRTSKNASSRRRAVTIAACCSVALIGIGAAAYGIISNSGVPILENPDYTVVNASIAEKIDADASVPTTARKEIVDPVKNRSFVPLKWNIAAITPVYQGSGNTGYWGTCGEVTIANTLNLLQIKDPNGNPWDEKSLVDFALQNEAMDPENGGMKLSDVVKVYVAAFGLDEKNNNLDVIAYGKEYAPSIEDIASKISSGKLVNVSVYGEMMREGGHTGEGDIYGTHWLLLYGVDYNADGSIAGFKIVDSASSATYITASDLSDIYFGHDGTNILDPSCVVIYGWEYVDY